MKKELDETIANAKYVSIKFYLLRNKKEKSKELDCKHGFEVKLQHPDLSTETLEFIKIHYALTEAQYEIAIKNHNYKYHRYYEKLNHLLKQLEELDHKRIEFTKNILLRFNTLQEQVCEVHLNELQKFKKEVQNILPDQFIQQFILENKSGNKPPPAIEFEPYIVIINLKNFLKKNR